MNPILFASFLARGLLAGAAFCMLAAPPAMASPEELSQKYPSGSIASVEQADRAVAEVQAERKEVEARYADAQYACYSKFFSSPCVDKAKEARRLALNRIGPIEVEAKAFKRRDTVAKRDKLLDEQQARDASDAPARAEQERVNQQKAAQKAADVAARQAAPETARGGRAPVTPRGDTTPKTGGRDRIAEHQARMEKERSQDAAEAEKRAKNIADYERKQKESLERQRRVAEKKAEADKKAQERAAKAGP
jgi:colicin import membrane protein